MKKVLITSAAALLSLSLQAQINMGAIVRDKVNQRAVQKANEAVDVSLDKTEEKAKQKPGTGKSKAGKATTGTNNSTTTDEAEETTDVPAKAAAGGGKAAPEELKSYSKFDFVPGETVFFYDDYAQDNIADFPARWNTNGSAEVVTTNLLQGKWMMLKSGGYFAPELKRNLPENYTIEFDIVMAQGDRKGHQGTLDFHIMSMKNTDQLGGYSEAYISNHLSFYSDNTSSFGIGNSTGTISNNVTDNVLHGMGGKKMHVSIAVNKQRYRIWYEDKKVFDLPRLMPTGHAFNMLRFDPKGFDESEPYTMLIGNLRIAEGTSDLRSKLLTEGKLVTRGITFDSGSDKIKPESYGTLKEIAKVLNENATVKVKIVGHTDSDGADATNLELSKKRAAAVRTALTNEFNVDGNRMETDGKGESVPASPNTTSEGKANNRRVEFIKI